MVHVADPLRRPGADGVARAHEVVRIVSVETLHSVGRTPTDTTGTVQAIQRVASADVVVLGRRECLCERLVVGQSRRQLAHVPGRFERAYRTRRPCTREPIQRRERLAVDERKGLDHRGQTAETADGDANLATQGTADLPLDRVAVFGVDLEGLGDQSSFCRMLRLMSA